MPRSQQPPDGEAAILQRILARPDARVVDVGACDGRWGRLLRGRVAWIVGVEVWQPYVEQHGLAALYDAVIREDVRTITTWWDEVDTVILCDVLEHMPRADADALVDRIRFAGATIYMSAPITFCYQDGTVYGNPFETHVDQYSHAEFVARGWKLLHRGHNENGLVEIGTYMMEPLT
jgi:predicted TPR repeat methyltransferase